MKILLINLTHLDYLSYKKSIIRLFQILLEFGLEINIRLIGRLIGI